MVKKLLVQDKLIEFQASLLIYLVHCTSFYEGCYMAKLLYMLGTYMKS